MRAAAERRVRPDRDTQDRLLADFETAAQRAEREEDELARFLIDSLSEEQRDEFGIPSP
jgi:hypothetical protein